jgi:disulfide bond formation protein DsbB
MKIFRSQWLPYAPYVLLAGSAGLLGGAFYFQFIRHLPPCVLCVLQRWPHGVVLVLAALSLLLPRWRAGLLALCGLALLTAAGIAVFHVGVEQTWWPGTSECGGLPQALTIEQLRAQIMGAPITRCGDVLWQFAGLSMAAWHALSAGLLAAFALLAAWETANAA